MTPRSQRLYRILHLRERVHEVAALDLRVAHGALTAAEAALHHINLAAQQSRDRQQTASPKASTEDWLLSCADAEFYKLARATQAKHIAHATAAVTTAAARETDGRRDRRQMEVTLEAVHRKHTYQAARAEQKRLDESSRHLLAFSHPAAQAPTKPF